MTNTRPETGIGSTWATWLGRCQSLRHILKTTACRRERDSFPHTFTGAERSGSLALELRRKDIHRSCRPLRVSVHRSARTLLHVALRSMPARDLRITPTTCSRQAIIRPLSLRRLSSPRIRMLAEKEVMSKDATCLLRLASARALSGRNGWNIIRPIKHYKDCLDTQKKRKTHRFSHPYYVPKSAAAFKVPVGQSSLIDISI